MVKLYWPGGDPIVSLRGVEDYRQGENVLIEFRDPCHRYYIAWSAATLGLGTQRERYSVLRGGGRPGFRMTARDVYYCGNRPDRPTRGLHSYEALPRVS